MLELMARVAVLVAAACDKFAGSLRSRTVQRKLYISTQQSTEHFRLRAACRVCVGVRAREYCAHNANTLTQRAHTHTHIRARYAVHKSDYVHIISQLLSLLSIKMAEKRHAHRAARYAKTTPTPNSTHTHCQHGTCGLVYVCVCVCTCARVRLKGKSRSASWCGGMKNIMSENIKGGASIHIHYYRCCWWC